MPNTDAAEVSLQNSEGETVEVEVGRSDKVTCPECDAKAPEQVSIHSLDRVLAGECAVCFHTWTIGPLTDWEVVPDE